MKSKFNGYIIIPDNKYLSISDFQQLDDNVYKLSTIEHLDVTEVATKWYNYFVRKGLDTLVYVKTNPFEIRILSEIRFPIHYTIVKPRYTMNNLRVISNYSTIETIFSTITKIKEFPLIFKLKFRNDRRISKEGNLYTFTYHDMDWLDSFVTYRCHNTNIFHDISLDANLVKARTLMPTDYWTNEDLRNFQRDVK